MIAYIYSSLITYQPVIHGLYSIFITFLTILVNLQ